MSLPFFQPSPDISRTPPTVILPYRAVCAPPSTNASGGRP